jgi:gamma-glutamylcyclotransferase (GGCT)/AIG2-like uncharacterized protein YtfP
MKVPFIAFYGTLLRSGRTPMHPHIAKYLLYQRECLIPGILYDLGDYPGLKPGRQPVRGELYAIQDSQILALLDEYESSDPDPPEATFSRQLVTLIEPHTVAWCYFFDGKVSRQQIIASNSWHKKSGEFTQPL